MKIKYRSTVQVDNAYLKTKKKLLRRKFGREFDEKFFSLLTNKNFAKMLKEKSTDGKCYFYALLLAKNLPESTLQYGHLQTLNRSVDDMYIEPFEHAWVEYQDLVFDTTAKCIFNKEKYYKTFDVKVLEKFSEEDLKDEKLLKTLSQRALNVQPELKEAICSFEPFNKFYKEDREKK